MNFDRTPNPPKLPKSAVKEKDESEASQRGMSDFRPGYGQNIPPELLVVYQSTIDTMYRTLHEDSDQSYSPLKYINRQGDSFTPPKFPKPRNMGPVGYKDAEDLRQELYATRSELNVIKQEKKLLASRIAIAEKNYDEMERQYQDQLLASSALRKRRFGGNDQFEAQLDGKALTKIKLSLRNAEKKIQEKDKELNELKQSTKYRSLQKFEVEINRYYLEVVRLKRLLEHQETGTQILDDDPEKLLGYDDAISELCVKLTEEQQITKNLTDKNDKLTIENERQYQTIETLSSQLSDLKNKHQDLSAEHEKLHVIHRHLSQEYTDLKNLHDNLSDQLHQTLTNLNDVSIKYTDARSEISRLTSSEEKLRSNLQELHEKHQQLLEVKSKIEIEIAEDKKCIRLLENDMAVLKNLRENLERTIERLAKDHKCEIDEKQDMIEREHVLVTELRIELASNQRQTFESQNICTKLGYDITALNDRIVHLESDVDAKQKLNISFENEISRQKGMCKSLETQLTECHHRNSALERNLVTLEIQSTNMKEKESEIEKKALSIENRNLSLQFDLNSSNQKVLLLESSIVSMEKKIFAQQSELIHCCETIKNMQDLIRTLDSQLAEKHHHILQLSEINESLQLQLNRQNHEDDFIDIRRSTSFQKFVTEYSEYDKRIFMKLTIKNFFAKTTNAVSFNYITQEAPLQSVEISFSNPCTFSRNKSEFITNKNDGSPLEIIPPENNNSQNNIANSTTNDLVDTANLLSDIETQISKPPLPQNPEVSNLLDSQINLGNMKNVRKKSTGNVVTNIRRPRSASISSKRSRSSSTSQHRTPSLRSSSKNLNSGKLNNSKFRSSPDNCSESRESINEIQSQREGFFEEHFAAQLRNGENADSSNFLIQKSKEDSLPKLLSNTSFLKISPEENILKNETITKNSLAALRNGIELNRVPSEIHFEKNLNLMSNDTEVFGDSSTENKFSSTNHVNSAEIEKIKMNKSNRDFEREKIESISTGSSEKILKFDPSMNDGSAQTELSKTNSLERSSKLLISDQEIFRDANIDPEEPVFEFEAVNQNSKLVGKSIKKFENQPTKLDYLENLPFVEQKEKLPDKSLEQKPNYNSNDTGRIIHIAQTENLHTRKRSLVSNSRQNSFVELSVGLSNDQARDSNMPVPVMTTSTQRDINISTESKEFVNTKDNAHIQSVASSDSEKLCESSAISLKNDDDSSSDITQKFVNDRNDDTKSVDMAVHKLLVEESVAEMNSLVNLSLNRLGSARNTKNHIVKSLTSSSSSIASMIIKKKLEQESDKTFSNLTSNIKTKISSKSLVESLDNNKDSNIHLPQNILSINDEKSEFDVFSCHNRNEIEIDSSLNNSTDSHQRFEISKPSIHLKSIDKYSVMSSPNSVRKNKAESLNLLASDFASTDGNVADIETPINLSRQSLDDSAHGITSLKSSLKSSDKSFSSLAGVSKLLKSSPTLLNLSQKSLENSAVQLESKNSIIKSHEKLSLTTSETSLENINPILVEINNDVSVENFENLSVKAESTGKLNTNTLSKSAVTVLKISSINEKIAIDSSSESLEKSSNTKNDIQQAPISASQNISVLAGKDAVSKDDKFDKKISKYETTESSQSGNQGEESNHLQSTESDREYEKSDEENESGGDDTEEKEKEEEDSSYYSSIGSNKLLTEPITFQPNLVQEKVLSNSSAVVQVESNDKVLPDANPRKQLTKHGLKLGSESIAKSSLATFSKDSQSFNNNTISNKQPQYPSVMNPVSNSSLALKTAVIPSVTEVSAAVAISAGVANSEESTDNDEDSEDSDGIGCTESDADFDADNDEGDEDDQYTENAGDGEEVGVKSVLEIWSDHDSIGTGGTVSVDEEGET
ncbi:hypothetical protein HK100_004408 [Physocladia obscura]|uniref:Uncharacterized protein n=1 Tax=Physocladia obscura TaxID=109957 RepID=A0AAD5T7D4_9FUNG|nr:hypothetical protein HK100_004408 [Physocladia obscura]